MAIKQQASCEGVEQRCCCPAAASFLRCVCLSTADVVAGCAGLSDECSAA